MRVPSLQKIEKQTQAYAAAHPVVMTEGWQKELAEAQKQREAALRKWHKIREKGCAEATTGKCTCKTLPNYKELVLDIIQPLTEKTNGMWADKMDMERDVYQTKLTELTAGRDARQRYKAQRAGKHSEIVTDISLAARSVAAVSKKNFIERMMAESIWGSKRTSP